MVECSSVSEQRAELSPAPSRGVQQLCPAAGQSSAPWPVLRALGCDKSSQIESFNPEEPSKFAGVQGLWHRP